MAPKTVGPLQTRGGGIGKLHKGSTIRGGKKKGRHAALKRWPGRIEGPAPGNEQRVQIDGTLRRQHETRAPIQVECPPRLSQSSLCDCSDMERLYANSDKILWIDIAEDLEKLLTKSWWTLLR